MKTAAIAAKNQKFVCALQWLESANPSFFERMWLLFSFLAQADISSACLIKLSVPGICISCLVLKFVNESAILCRKCTLKKTVEMPNRDHLLHICENLVSFDMIPCGMLRQVRHVGLPDAFLDSGAYHGHFLAILRGLLSSLIDANYRSVLFHGNSWA